MEWNKVELRKKDKNLPSLKTRVLWVTNEDAPTENSFHYLIGELTEDGKFVDFGYRRYKLTSKYWWMELPKHPIIE